MFTSIDHHNNPAPTVAIDFIPQHKGFEAIARLPFWITQRRKFATLHQAQVWVRQYEQTAQKFRCNSVSNGSRRYSIRNLESGKFCTHKWTATRADMVA